MWKENQSYLHQKGRKEITVIGFNNFVEKNDFENMDLLLG